MEDAIIPVVLFLVIGSTVLGSFFWNHKNRLAVMETVQKAIDHGSQLTPDLLMKLGAAANPRVRDLRRGIIFLALGVAGLLCSLFFTDSDIISGIRAGSMFPLILGAGFLLVWRMTRNQE